MTSHFDRSKVYKIHVYRNGDRNFYGKTLIVNRRQVPTIDSLLNLITDHVGMTSQARQLRTPDHGHFVVRNMDDLVDDQSYVAVAAGGFKPLPYTNLREIQDRNLNKWKRDRDEAVASTQTRLPPIGKVTGKESRVAAQFIHVYVNGVPYTTAKGILVSPKYHPTWKHLLRELDTVLKPTFGPVDRLFTMEGSRVNNLRDLASGNYYVAAGGVRPNFKRVEYGSTKSFVWPQKSSTTTSAPTSLYLTNHIERLQTQENTSNNTGHKQNTTTIRLITEADGNPVYPLMSDRRTLKKRRRKVILDEVRNKKRGGSDIFKIEDITYDRSDLSEAQAQDELANERYSVTSPTLILPPLTPKPDHSIIDVRSRTPQRLDLSDDNLLSRISPYPPINNGHVNSYSPTGSWSSSKTTDLPEKEVEDTHLTEDVQGNGLEIKEQGESQHGDGVFGEDQQLGEEKPRNDEKRLEDEGKILADDIQDYSEERFEMAARKIQRAYRVSKALREAVRQNQLLQQQLNDIGEDEAEEKRFEMAARRIQRAYRASKARREAVKQRQQQQVLQQLVDILEDELEKKRFEQAARKIQRAFRISKALRQAVRQNQFRKQQLNDAVEHESDERFEAAARKIQRAFRASKAREAVRRSQLQQQEKQQQQQLQQQEQELLQQPQQLLLQNSPDDRQLQLPIDGNNKDPSECQQAEESEINSAAHDDKINKDNENETDDKNDTGGNEVSLQEHVSEQEERGFLEKEKQPDAIGEADKDQMKNAVSSEEAIVIRETPIA